MLHIRNHNSVNSLILVVEEATRGENEQCFIQTDNPSTFIRSETIPGISYHDIFFAGIDMVTKKKIQKNS